MPFQLGPRDETRFAALEEEARDYRLFQLDFCLGILGKRPAQAEALESAAAGLTALGYYHAGLTLDRRLCRLFPEDPTALYNLACSLALTCRTEEALAALAKAIDRGYRDARHMVRDADLGNLLDLPEFAALVTRAEGERRKGTK